MMGPEVKREHEKELNSVRALLEQIAASFAVGKRLSAVFLASLALDGSPAASVATTCVLATTPSTRICTFIFPRRFRRLGDAILKVRFRAIVAAENRLQLPAGPALSVGSQAATPTAAADGLACPHVPG